MEENMKEMTKKTAVVAMAGIMAAGMLTGCGEKKLDGSKTVATVDGTEIPLGVVSLSVRDGQMQTEAMYRSYMGGSDFDIWDTEAEKGKTYGEQHAANIENFMNAYPDTTIVANTKTFGMMKNFFRNLDLEGRTLEVGNGESLTLGRHVLTFVFAPMVHWPEVMVTYDSTDKVLFSADGFGKFGALDVEEDWDCEARRYYIGIVGKYGPQVQKLLKVAATLDIQIICPLHGPVLTENLGHYIEKYDIWSSYKVEDEGVVIAYTSVYGNTKKAVEILAEKLKEKGCPKVTVFDLARDDMAEAVADAFRYGKLVLATITYNADIFPFMKTYIDHLTERSYQNRTIGLIENGSWAPNAAKVMQAKFEKSKNITWLDNTVKIMSSLSDENIEELDKMAEELCK